MKQRMAFLVAAAALASLFVVTPAFAMTGQDFGTCSAMHAKDKTGFTGAQNPGDHLGVVGCCSDAECCAVCE